MDPYEAGHLITIDEIASMLATNLQLPLSIRPTTAPTPSSSAASSDSYNDDLATSSSAAGAASHSEMSPSSGMPNLDAKVSGATAGGSRTPDVWFAQYLQQPASKREILLRLLRNMREAYWMPLMGRQASEVAYIM